ncbi:DUF2283 domain-containing protein [Streptomyces sp. ME08-AFT2]|uniref:DUF2283 domain-containing protein n=1 Tax=Streptomyces sp. ME08-AFT2 TaxID=3028683 RepID=UPI0029AD5FF0|nr:DUF2283 domain-containing protein [Streptomyces sp. ME08-AFT2]MDX3313633.1 DUF2283 domain-containing protein [Streptomyces sp. ME08-AFT2]
MRVTLDAEVDAAYLYLGDPQVRPQVARTYLCDPVDAGMINLDFDDEGRLLGVEVLGAGSKLSRHLLDTAERLDT